ncbi:MAG: hypothetical protein LBM61_05695 [Prevotellaceae bacterium]|jgi:lipopolysaccharide export system protein LptA|nr:hypothetical protein [Prevotellaceae bacterium]
MLVPCRNIRFVWFLAFICLAGSLYAQEQRDTVAVERRTRVDLLHADRGYANQDLLPDVQVLVGHVQLRHDSMYMYCDSAHLYEKTNSFEAFDNVRMEQGDTLFVYADYLYYDGVSRIAMLRRNVRMINRNTTLTTDSLNYDRVTDLGYYFAGGQLADEENTLTSEWGQYSPATKVASFNHQVHLDNARFTMDSDTLRYSTETKISVILGPSHIHSDSTYIYSERGIYNTITEQSELLDRSVVRNGSSTLVGDSVFYDRLTGYGEAFNDVVMNDTVNRSMLTGDYCFYNQQTGSALATNRAVAIDYSQGDSLFTHADTLRLITYHINTDSMWREMRAYNKVRTYRTDIQAVCDSLVFTSRDSCLSMYKDPILWNGAQQLLGEEIKIYMNDSTIEWAHIINQALVVEQKDSAAFNQVSGKEIKTYFRNGEAYKAEVIGNVLVAYYIEEKANEPMMFVRMESSMMDLFIDNRQWQRVVFFVSPTGTGYPMTQIPADQLRLANFSWFDSIRPRSKEDIFEWRSKGAGEELKKTTRRAITPSRDMINAN